MENSSFEEKTSFENVINRKAFTIKKHHFKLNIQAREKTIQLKDLINKNLLFEYKTSVEEKAFSEEQ